MELKLEYTKALRLLDAEREEEAIALLERVQLESMHENDMVHFVRSSLVLGEFFFNLGDVDGAQRNLEMVIEAILDEDDAELLDMEVNQARELLNNL